MKKYILILGLILGAGIALSSQITNVLNSAADLSGKTLVTAEGNRTISGTFTFTVPQRFTAGTASNPGITAGTDTTTGVVLGVGTIGWSLSGTQRGLLDASGLTIYGNNLVNSTGKIPAISSTYFTSLDGSNLTGTGLMLLLKANSGTDTNASATNVDTVVISGLTAKDTLIVEVSMAAVTQPVSTPSLYNSTDSVVITNLTNGGAGMTAGTYTQQTAKIRQAQSGPTNIYAYAVGLDPGVVKVGSGTTFANPTFATNWTGAWTLALRHGGVTTGGTCQWSWAVYKLAGQ